MKRTNYILTSLLLAAIVVGAAVWNFNANPVSAQEKAETEIFGGDGVVQTEYNARDEFSLTQGGTSGVWNYGYSTSDTDNTFNLYANNDTVVNCGSAMFQRWFDPSSGDLTPQIARNTAAVPCISIPPEALFLHPGPTGRRSVLRWTAPAAGTYLLNGVLGKQNPSATSDLKILKNVTEPALFSANFIDGASQHPFNFTVTVAMGDTIDFSVGWGNGSYSGDATLLAVTVGQPVTACLTAPANLQVFVPGENSPSDVQSVNTNASLVGDATYTNMGKVGRAFTLDGNGDYVRIEDNAAQRPATAVTAEGWFKFNTAPGIATLISKPIRNSADNSYILYTDGGQLRGYVGNTSQFTRVFSNFSPQPNVWHHLAFTYDFSGGISTLKLYANGVEVTSGQDGTPNLPLFYDANPHPLLIGGELENNAPGFTLNGQADEVSIYSRALAQTEIFDIVQQGSFGKCPPAACVQSPNNLVSWYQGEQNALDSRSNNHGTNNGATFANGRVGQAFSFDGVDDYVATPDDNSLDITGDLTLEAWVRPAQIQAGEVTLIDKRDTANSNINYVLFLRNGELRFASRTGGGAFSENGSGVILTAGVFTHVAATIQNGSFIFYINGTAGNAQVAPVTRTASTGRLIIGATETSSLSGFFNGLIDEVSIYNRALSATEISSIVNAGQSGKCKPSPLNPAANLVGFWTGDGDTRDFAGLDQNGTNNGATFAVGKVGQAFNFTANPQNVLIPDSPALRPANFTIEAWTKSLNNGGTRHILGKTLGTSTADSYVFWVQNGNLNGAICSDATTCFTISTAAPNTGEWHHLALSFDDASDTLRIFVDGVQAQSGTTALSIGYDTHAALIGADYANEVITDSWNGQLDEVSFYDRALTASEIAAVYNAGTAGKLKSAPTPVNFARTAKTEASFAPTTVNLSSASITFNQVTTAGTTSQSGLDLGLLPALPPNVMTNNLNYDLSTTAAYTGNVTVCFNVPAIPVGNFTETNIVHLENGAWVNPLPNTTTRNYPQICGDFSSLSPFAVVQGLAPSAAEVPLTGRVIAGQNTGVADATVYLTDQTGNVKTARTNSFGYYRFDEVEVGQTYIINVYSRRYQFTPQVVSVTEEINVNFTANE